MNLYTVKYQDQNPEKTYNSDFVLKVGKNLPKGLKQDTFELIRNTIEVFCCEYQQEKHISLRGLTVIQDFVNSKNLLVVYKFPFIFIKNGYTEDYEVVEFFPL